VFEHGRQAVIGLQLALMVLITIDSVTDYTLSMHCLGYKDHGCEEDPSAKKLQPDPVKH
jgi:hypothetical protein